MAKTFRLRKDEPLLNIASYARGGLRAADRLTPSQIEQIRLTVNRAPEAVVKVLSRSSNDLKAVGKHIDYIGRRGNLELEGDDGERLRGRVGVALIDDWDLDIDDVRRQGSLTAASKRNPPKIVHKLLFSMPPGTPPHKVLSAVRNFAREEFHGQHRYAMVLHTDEPHPHVHLVLKAVSEQGVRLNIKKATLRRWRAQFARQLRAQGVAANATERSVRGVSKSHHHDGIYRAMRRGASMFYRQRAIEVATEMANGGLKPESGTTELLGTRQEIVRGWQAAAQALARDGQQDLARKVADFVRQMPPVRTDKEHLAASLIEHHRRRRIQEKDLTR